jgi:hypothetical protein
MNAYIGVKTRGQLRKLRKVHMDPITLATIAASVLTQSLDAKNSYMEKLEEAHGDDIFKYILLINTAALDSYIAQARLQAEQSFRLSRRMALAGFVLLAVGIALGIISTATGNLSLNAAYLATVGGALTQFISGVMLYMYNQTLRQLHQFHDKMVSSQHASMAFLGTTQLSMAQLADEKRAELSSLLLSSATQSRKDS